MDKEGFQPYLSPEKIQQQNAAAELEELILVAKETVKLLRESQAPIRAYALMYLLRKNMSKIVATLGVGVPDHQSAKWAQDIYDTETCTSQS